MSSFNGIAQQNSSSSTNNFFGSGSSTITTDTSFSNVAFTDVLSGTVDTSLATSSNIFMIWASISGTLTSGTGSFNWRITLDGVTLIEAGVGVFRSLQTRQINVSPGTHTIKLQVQSTNSGGAISIRPQTQPAESCWLMWQISYV